jgi:hypothetical protein
MREDKRWLLRKNKVPYYVDGNLRSGELDSELDLSRLGTFDQAQDMLKKGGFDGLGFALGPDGTGNHWQGIDLDNVEANGLQALANSLVGYVEYSPSGLGCHAIGYGKPFEPLKLKGIEAYSGKRYFTFSGKAIGGKLTDQAPFVATHLEPLRVRPVTAAPLEAPSAPTQSDDAIVASLLRDPALAPLCNGTSGGNPSEDDLSLVNAIAFRSRNRAQTERVWLASPLGQRDKTQRRADYRKRTLDAAFNFPELPPLDLSGINCKGEPLSGNGPTAAPKPSRAGIRASDLQHKQFAPVRYIVPGIITQGLTILGGRPKLGKSWLCLGAALAVAEGGYVLGSFCQPGDVAYFALEDTQRRLQSRMWKVRGKEPWPSNLELFVELPRGAEGLAQVRCWLEQNPTAKLILIDTLAKVRPANKNENRYDADYQAVADWKSLADEFDVGIVLVHHTRKQEADDPLEMISGTNGITGAADSIILLDRNGQGSFLLGRGRDLEEFAISIRLDENGQWQNLGDVDDVLRSDERNSILNLLRQTSGPMSPKDIAHGLSAAENSTRQLLYKMVNKGELEKTGRGQYAIPAHTPPHNNDKTGNNGKTDKTGNKGLL